MFNIIDGASVCAFHCLAKWFDYTMVYCETSGVNCFWLRNDLLTSIIDIDVSVIQSVLNPSFLFKTPSFYYKSTSKSWQVVSC